MVLNDFMGESKLVSVEIHELAFFVDKAFEEKDIRRLKQISKDCLEWSKLNKYNFLEKGILSYHGGTAASDYIQLKHREIKIYDENEKDIELCLLLFRNCVKFFYEFKQGFIDTCSKEEMYYFIEY